MSNGFGSLQNSQGAAAGSAGIAAALQNVLQAGQSSSMQQVNKNFSIVYRYLYVPFTFFADIVFVLI
jgi:hypothetical protein